MPYFTATQQQAGTEPDWNQCSGVDGIPGHDGTNVSEYADPRSDLFATAATHKRYLYQAVMTGLICAV